MDRTDGRTLWLGSSLLYDVITSTKGFWQAQNNEQKRKKKVFLLLADPRGRKKAVNNNKTIATVRPGFFFANWPLLLSCRRAAIFPISKRSWTNECPSRTSGAIKRSLRVAHQYRAETAKPFDRRMYCPRRRIEKPWTGCWELDRSGGGGANLKVINRSKRTEGIYCPPLSLPFLFFSFYVAVF